MTKKVIITDRMQRGDVYWHSEPVGRNFAPGFTHRFEDVEEVMPVMRARHPFTMIR